MKIRILFIFFISIILFSSFFPRTPQRVLFVGDSLTCYSNGWQDNVCKTFSYQSTNLSVGGKRTLWMYETLSNHLKKDSKYNQVFIYGGCNDAFSYVDLKESIKNIQSMIDLCNKKDIIPIVIVGYDPNRVMTKTIYDEKTTAFHRARYVELQKMMVDTKTGLKDCIIIPKDTTLTNFDTSDGIHLNSSGHRKFTNWVIQQLKLRAY